MARTTVKDKLLDILTRSDGDFISGNALAESLSVTRAAVWKAVNALRADGFEIDGTTNKGYRLSGSSGQFNAHSISAMLTPEASAFYNIECVDVIDSTNTAVKARAAAEPGEGLIIIARQQTAGRGRMGRRFHSPMGTGVYMSILLRPKMPASDAVHITAAAAVAAAEAIEEVCPAIGPGGVQIKWVNDLFLDDKKICGILTEAGISVENTYLEYAVLGLGFNIRTPEGGWPEEIKDTAGSLDSYLDPVITNCSVASGGSG
ncbi:MAG: biotin--[acetyl-CoA-carboxylase] ligase, partial [Eubacteriales bacterium]|nr:biotin--[acetyl-CoA-carboxylase] ligase [Eubacteriales bacterium]